MELFTAVAKLVLDTTEYDRAIGKVEGKTAPDIEATLDLDKSEFDEKIEDANSEEVEVDDAKLDLDKGLFDGKIDDAEAEKVEDKETKLDLDPEPFEQGLADAQAATGPFEESIGSVFNNIGSMIIASGVAAAITGIVSSLGEAVDLARTLGDDIDKSSRAMGISTDTYQKLKYVMDLSGASLTDLNRGLLNMEHLLNGGELSEEAVAAFNELGISAKVASGEIKNTDDLLVATLKALADESGPNRSKFAEAIFGRNYRQLNAMFDMTGSEIDTLMQKAEDLGLVMTPDEIANAAAYNDSVTTLQAELDALKTSFVKEILPILKQAVDGVVTILAFFNGRAGGNSLSDMFADADETLAKDLVTIEATGSAAEKMVDKLFSWGDASKLTAEQQAEWKETAAWLIEKIPELSDVIDLDTLSITANKDEVYATIEAWKAYAIQRAKNNALQAKEEALAKKTTEWLDAEAKAREIDRKMMLEQEKLNVLLKRDFENMPKQVQTEVAIKLGYETPEAINWDDDLTYRRLENMLGMGGQYSAYGSRELDAQISTITTGMHSLAIESANAHKEADALREEVDAGQAELLEYSATLDDIVGDLFDTGKQANQTTKEVEKLSEALKGLPESKTIQIGMDQVSPRSSYWNAKGNWSVPYDNFPALLHRDEMVLTKSQARRYRDGGGGDVDYGVIGQMIGTAINDAMGKVYIMLSGEKVGDLTTRRISNNMNASSYSKLRAMGG